MPLPPSLHGRLRLPVMAAPMFIASGPELVIAQCLAGIIGSFPALNARPASALADWLVQIRTGLEAHQASHPEAPPAPYAVNLVVHHSNRRLDEDIATCLAQRVPLLITSLASARATPLAEIVTQAHAQGSLVFHDVTTIRHARKALAAGVDGLILVCAGAGGHAGRLNPIAFASEVRTFYDGPLVLSGTISTGAGILAARALGCELAYLGTRFIATEEARAPDAFKQMVLQAHAEDIVYTPLFSGVPANFLKASVRAAGLDPEHLPEHSPPQDHVGDHDSRPKAWKDVWSAGQGVGSIQTLQPTADVIAQLAHEYQAALAALARA